MNWLPISQLVSWKVNQLLEKQPNALFIGVRIAGAHTGQPAPAKHQILCLIGWGAVGKVALRLKIGGFRWLEEKLRSIDIGQIEKGLFIIGCNGKLNVPTLWNACASASGLRRLGRGWTACIACAGYKRSQVKSAQPGCARLGRKQKIIGFNKRTVAQLSGKEIRIRDKYDSQAD